MGQPVERPSNTPLSNLYAGWHTVNDSADALTVAFAKGGQGEYVSEGVPHS